MTSRSSLVDRKESLKARTRRTLPRRRRVDTPRVESLEGRALLAYMFSLAGDVATVTGSGPLIIQQVNNFLEYSQNGGATFSTDWSGDGLPDNLPAAPTTTVNISVDAVLASPIQLGTTINSSSAASGLNAQFNVSLAVGNTASVVINDSAGAFAAGSNGAEPYLIDLGNAPFQVRGPGIRYNEPTGFATGGVTLIGSQHGNIFNLNSTFTNEPVTVLSGSGNDTLNIATVRSGLTVDLGGGSDVINVGPVGGANLEDTILGPGLNVTDGGGGVTLNINDQGGNDDATITSAAVTGISAPINYGAGVTDVVLNGPTGSARGYSVLSSRAGTTATINAGPFDDFILVGGDSLGGLAGPVVINGGGQILGDRLDISDRDSATSRDYSLTGTQLAIGGLSTVDYSNVELLDLTTGRNSDSVTVLGTSVQTTIRNSTNVPIIDGSETVNVGNGNVDGVQGALFLENASGLTTLTIDDSANPNGKPLVTLFSNGLGNNTLFNLAPAPISYLPGQLTNSAILLGQGDDAFTFTTDLLGGPTATNTTIDGGGGFNTLVYSGYPSPVFVDLGLGLATGTNGISNFDGVNGSDFGNVIIGNDNPNILVGGAGADQIFGLDGADRIFGLGGPDTLVGGRNPGGTFDEIFGGDDNDVIIWNPGDGNDNVDGGAGEDTQEVNRGGGNNGTNLVRRGSRDDLGAAAFTFFDAAAFNIQMTDVQLLQIDGEGGNDEAQIDFVAGSPFDNLTGVNGGPGVLFNGGFEEGDFDLLRIFRSGGDHVIQNQAYFAADAADFAGFNGPARGASDGVIIFDGGRLDFYGLSPVEDSAPAVNYTANLPFLSNATNIEDSPGANGVTPALAIVSADQEPHYERYDLANKTNVTVNSPDDVLFFPLDQSVRINNPSGAAGLQTLTVNTSLGNDQFFVNVLPGNAEFTTASINSGSGQDTFNVDGAGVLDGKSLTLDGSAGNADVLNLNTGGVNYVASAGPVPGSVILTPPPGSGLGPITTFNIEAINLDGQQPAPPVAGAPRPFNSVEAFQLVDHLVATFTAAAGTESPTAADFVATIDWGDGTTPTAGTIVQDASDPSVFNVFGTHIYQNPGAFNATITLRSVGTTTIVNGVTITTEGLSEPVTVTDAVTVNQGPLAVSAFPLSGIEGASITAGPVASFIDAGGSAGVPDPIDVYTATLEIVNSAGDVVLALPPGDLAIVQNDSTNSYRVDTLVPISLATLGNGEYTVRVTVTKTLGGTTNSALGVAGLTVGDSALTAVPVPPLGVAPLAPIPEGSQLTDVLVASFTDPFAGALTSDFTATIDWGDGSPISVGTITQPGGAGTPFQVLGSHKYADEGAYSIQVVILEEAGGSLVTGTTATVVNAVLSDPVGIPVPATEAVPLFDVPLGTFLDANKGASPVDFSVTINWGDGTPLDTDTGAVQLIGGTATQARFRVLGSHTYADNGTFNITVTVTDAVSGDTITIATVANVANVNPATVVVTGTTFSAVEGDPGTVTNVLVATFSVADPTAVAGDFTALVTWGDGESSSTADDNVTIEGPAGGPFRVIATKPNPYGEEGIYQTTISIFDIDDPAGPVLVGLGTGQAIVSDAPLIPGDPITITTTEAALFPIPVFAPPVFSGTVATFTTVDQEALFTDFFATIDWGDGTPLTAGRVRAVTNGGLIVPGSFFVEGDHTYATAGNDAPQNYEIRVYVRHFDGSEVTIPATAIVNEVLFIQEGILDPASDSGAPSNPVTFFDGITNVNQPTFTGVVEPFASVEVFVNDELSLGRVQADGSGHWSLTSEVALPDGIYAVTAIITDQFGVNVTDIDIITNDVFGDNTLLIDTVGPQVTGMFFVKNVGEMSVSFQDFGPEGNDLFPVSGLIDADGNTINSLIDNRNWKIERLRQRPGRFLFTSLEAEQGVDGAAPLTVFATINNGQNLRSGTFTFSLFSGPLGITDAAGNPLDGEFYGYFPSGNDVPGGDFVAILDTIHALVYSPKPTQGYASPRIATRLSPGTPGDALLLRRPPRGFTVLPPFFTPPRPPISLLQGTAANTAKKGTAKAAAIKLVAPKAKAKAEKLAAEKAAHDKAIEDILA